MVSEHFSLEEVEHTDHDIQNTIPNPYLENAKRLASDVLEPLRIILGPLHVDSWYRSPALNAAVKGEPTSYHLEALAADVIPQGNVFDKFKMALTLLDELPIDQIIYEKRWSEKRQRWSEWIHVGTSRSGKQPRKMALVSHSDPNGKMVYKRFEA